jgi:hypothetical protein
VSTTARPPAPSNLFLSYIYVSYIYGVYLNESEGSVFYSDSAMYPTKQEKRTAVG